jgi:hypothetical protein
MDKQRAIVPTDFDDALPQLNGDVAHAEDPLR